MLPRVCFRLALLASIACAAACGARSELVEPAPPNDAATVDAPVAPVDAGGCGPLTTTPTELATFGTASVVGSGALEPIQLVVAGGAVYVEVLEHSIERVPLAGGATTTVLTATPGCATSPFSVGALVSDGTHLYTIDTEAAGCTGYPRHVTALDLSDGSVTMLPNPLDGPEVRVVGVVASSDRTGALWFSQDEYAAMPSANLVRWDGTSASILGTAPGLGVDFIAAGDTDFEETYHELYALPLSDPHPMASPIEPVSIDTFQFIAANHHAVFSASGDTIVRRDVATGTESTVVTRGAATHARYARAGWADDDWLYYFAGTTTPSLARVPQRGGASETLWSDPRRQLVAVTSDACSVYWLVGRSYSPDEHPPALMGRRR